MAYTANKLITNAYYVGDIVGKEYEQPNASQLAYGLEALNELFASTEFEKSLVPYFTNYTFNAVIGQESYDIPDLIASRILTFTLNTVRYALQYQQRDAYFGSFRANNINSLMFVNHIERNEDGATLYMYFNPDQAYPCQIWGLFRLPSVTQFQDLELTLSTGYINFLKYALARKLCIDTGRGVPENVEKEYERIYDSIAKNSATVDLSVKKLSTFGNVGTPNYGFANLGRGWLPPGMT